MPSGVRPPKRPSPGAALLPSSDLMMPVSSGWHPIIDKPPARAQTATTLAKGPVMMLIDLGRFSKGDGVGSMRGKFPAATV